MQDLLGASPGVFIGFTVILFGGAAFMTGQAIARTWRPGWQVVPYALLLAAADRFLSTGLFGGRLLSVPAYLVAALVLGLIAFAAWRMTFVRKMATQYPWLYRRTGLFAYRDIARDEPAPLV
jgi:hypothetical protein